MRITKFGRTGLASAAALWKFKHLLVFAALAVSATSLVAKAQSADVAVSRATVPNAELWGPLAPLAGTSWLNGYSGDVVSYRWQIPGEVLIAEVVGAKDRHMQTYRLDAPGKVAGELVRPDGSTMLFEVSFPRPGVAFWMMPSHNARATVRFGDGISDEVIEQQQPGGNWARIASYTSRRLDPAEIKSALATVTQANERATTEREAQAAELARVWGPVASLANFFWRGAEQTWFVHKTRLKSVGILGRVTEGPDAYQVLAFTPTGQRIPGYFIFTLSKAGELLLRDDKVPRLPDGAIYAKHYRHALLPKGPNAFEWVPGSLNSGIFSPDARGAKSGSGRYQRLSSAHGSAFDALIAQRDRETKAAESQRKAQSGSSGLFGALAMATGAALAGGNAEQVMGMAMKGAELTTDNEMSRNVLAGQGDAMVAEGTQRMIAENARSNGAGAGGASSSTVDSPGSAAAASNTAALSTSVSQAFVACNLYGQYASGTNWQFYVSRIGQVQTATGEFWPDSPSDPIAKSWGNYLQTTGVDVDVFAQGPNPDLPVCHGFHTEAEAAQARARWISDVQSGSGGYTVHTVDWSPSGVNQ